MLLLTDAEGRSLAAQATLSVDKATFEAVSTAIVERLGPKQVWYRLSFTRYQCCSKVIFYHARWATSQAIMRTSELLFYSEGITSINIVAGKQQYSVH